MKARLTIESDPSGDLTHKVIELSLEEPATLGRSRDNTVVLRDEHASRLHAKIYFQEGTWYLRDFGLNGTRLDGERIHQVAVLDHGQEIRIGDTRIRFTLAEPPRNITPRIPVKALDRATMVDADITAATIRLQPDELTVLCQLITTAIEETTASNLVRRALNLLLNQTHATQAGYLNDDPSEPLAKLVLPETASLDAPFSRQLTRRVQGTGKTVWLGADPMEGGTSDSLLALHDALCVPLRSHGASLGALHIYKHDSAFNEREVRFAEVLAGYLANHLLVLRTRRSLEAENARLRGRAPTADDLVGDSPTMLQLRQQIERAATQPFAVLIQGENGVGKELVALALHRASKRADAPFVVVNCEAIAPPLQEAELFGSVKGAFSGDDRPHPGWVQQADEGTLFFDEIAELSLECQSKLLRVIEGKAFRPIGATSESKVDVRILAATNRDLEAEVKAQRFRQDLFFRLKVISLTVPPLREHREDIPYLVQYFLDRLAVECHRTVAISEAALLRLQEQPWPGNVRQLRAVLECAVAMCSGETIEADDLALGNTRG